MKQKTLMLVTLLTGMLTFSMHTYAGDHVIIVKGGTFNLEDRSQTVDLFLSGPVDISFEEKNSLFGVEYDHVFNNNFSIGGGLELYSMDYVTDTPGTGSIDVSFIMFNGKYYFTKSSFKPFVGASAGFALTDFGGDIIGNSIGLAIAVTAGFRYQFSPVGIYVEYKNYLTADTADEFEAEVNVAGDGIYAGLSFQF